MPAGFSRQSVIYRVSALSSVQQQDRDGGNNAQRDDDKERDPHANRNAPGKRGLTGWDSHEPREPFVFRSQAASRSNTAWAR
jgi:hypothetical protein